MPDEGFNVITFYSMMLLGTIVGTFHIVSLKISKLFDGVVTMIEN